jgi:diacylglycerol kinase (ATP)
MKKEYLAIVNPAAGFGKCGKLLEPALDRLRRAGIDFEVAKTERAGHATEIVRGAWRDGYRKFIAVGGDGTSFEIVNGLFPEAAGPVGPVGPGINPEERPVLGFLPLGTGNSFLRDFTNEGAEYTLKALAEGRRRPCDVIRLKHRDGEIFYINILSLGFVANVCIMANQRFKPLGAAGYGLSVLLCLASFEKRVYQLKIDGVLQPDTPPTALLIFNNSKFTGGHMMLAPNADIGDGQIEIVRWSADRFDFIRNFPKCYDGSHVAHPLIWQGRARRIDFDFRAPIDIMIDGEVMTVHCESLEAIPSALTVVV